MKKFRLIVLEALPVVFMVALIPYFENDYLLTMGYVLVIVVLLAIKRERNDLLVFALGFVAMIFFEAFFIHSGVEKFTRTSFFGLMPLWLPFLWGYGFIAIKRSLAIIENKAD